MKKGTMLGIGIFICMVILITVLFCLISSQAEVGNEKHVYVEAKLPEYNSLTELESAADLIIIGEKVSEAEPTIIETSEGTFGGVYTLSSFKIEEVKAGNASPSDVITILENEGYVEEYNMVFHVAGYEKMICGEKYLLFVREATDGEWYIPLGVNIGKVPMALDERVISNVCTDGELINSVISMHELIRDEYAY